MIDLTNEKSNFPKGWWRWRGRESAVHDLWNYAAEGLQRIDRLWLRAPILFLPELQDHPPHGVRAALKEKGRTALGYSTLNPPGVLSRAESLRAVGAVKAVAVLLKFR